MQYNGHLVQWNPSSVSPVRKAAVTFYNSKERPSFIGFRTYTAVKVWLKSLFLNLIYAMCLTNLCERKYNKVKSYWT